MRQAVIQVRDNGVGIPPEQLPLIFDMFAQADRPLERKQGGLGIGLTLVRRLVEMHGGSVEARSAGVGHGAEFVVSLPILRIGGETSSGQIVESPCPDSVPCAADGALRVLVVDDNRDAANSLGILLRLTGCDVRVVYDGRTAVEEARTYRPRVLFVDLGMPGMDGLAVARELRGEPDLNGAVLVALTGWGQPEDRRRTAEAGFDHHLTKPADPQALTGLLSKLASRAV
jgi:CheY-like chemotaxis protein